MEKEIIGDRNAKLPIRILNKSREAVALPMNLVTKTTTRTRALIDCRTIATVGEKWETKAREYFYLQQTQNDERANSELIGAMTIVGDDYDYQATIATSNKVI